MKTSSIYIMDKSEHHPKQFGRRLRLVEIEYSGKTPETCPKCKSTEGFWLIAKHDSTLFQCKHCAAILETREAFIETDKKKPFKLVIKLHR